MIKNIILICLSLIIIFPIVYVSALPGNAELTLENIQIDPPYPKKGELVRVTGDVYNSGIKETDSFASVISVAYFINGKLLHVDELGNVKPGIGKKIKISSDLIWNAEIGDNIVKVIIDYHDTLDDKYDSPADNISEKSFSVQLLDSEKASSNTSSDGIPDKDTITNEFTINPEIPKWVRTNAGWWADGQIDDISLIDGLQFLIKKNILQPPINRDDTSASDEIPKWVRTNAGWWADGQIDDMSYINLMQFLIEKGIINMP